MWSFADQFGFAWGSLSSFSLQRNIIDRRAYNFIMNNSRKRQYSLKALAQPISERKETPLTIEKTEKIQKVRIGKLLPTIAQNREVHKLQAKELSYNINKFQHTVLQQQSLVNPEEMIRNALFILKSFGDVDNNFKGLFTDLYVKIKPYLFLNEGEIAVRYHLQQGMSYKKVCKSMDKFHVEMMALKDEKISQIQEQFMNLKKQTEKQKLDTKAQMAVLNQELQKYKKLADVQYVRSLQKKVAHQKEAISSQEEEYRILARKNEDASLQIQSLRKQKAALQVEFALSQEKNYDMSVLREKTEIYLLNLKDRFDELMTKMIGIRQAIQKVERQNDSLMSERIKLLNRAAVSFEELTPRPKYSQHFLFQRNVHIKPTNEIFDSLIQELGANKDKLFQKYFVSKKNRKLMECEAIREKTVQDIIKAKTEVHELL